MLNYHILLVNAGRNKTIGNHKVKRVNEMRYFSYHGNYVCVVNDDAKEFELYGCGYENHISTKNCLNGYRQYFKSKGYKELNPKPIYKYEEE